MRILSAIAIALTLAGCATTGDMMKLEIGMTKKQVIQALGKPDAARGSIINRSGQRIEVWEYVKQKATNTLPVIAPVTYWVYFCDGTMVQWGEAGDWKQEADRIYEMRFR